MHGLRPLLVAALVVAVYQAALTFSGFSTALQGRMVDGDAYMWLMRVTDLHRSGDWYAQWQAQTDAPFGETLHWTRPFDTVLLLGALAGSLFTDFDHALWGWGMVVSPVLMLVTLPVWSWGARPLLSARQWLLAMTLMLLCWRIGIAFEPARPDHHGFLAVLFVTVVAGLLRLVAAPGPGRVAWLTGAVAGLALWASIEMTVLVVYAASVLTLAWILGWHRRSDRVMRYLGGAAMVVLVGLMLQRPPAQWLTERYAQLAAPHGWLMISAALAWGAVTLAESRSLEPWPWRRRLAAAALAGGAVTASMAVVYPRFFLGPWIDYDMRYVADWLSSIGEFKPIWPSGGQNTGIFLIEAGPPLVALGWCAFALWRLPQWRRVAAVHGLGLVVYTGLGMNQGRWMHDAQLLALLPWALLVSGTWTRLAGMTPLAWRAVARAVAVLVLTCGPAVTGALAVGLSSPRPKPASCAWADMGRWLNSSVPHESIVMTHYFPGPELAWWGKVRVVGASFGHDSIWETWHFFSAEDDILPLQSVHRRGLDYVMVCPPDTEKGLGAEDPKSLYARLAEGQPPTWLRPVDLPQPLAQFRLYQVKR